MCVNFPEDRMHGLLVILFFLKGVSSHPYMRGDLRHFDFIYFPIQGVQQGGQCLYTIESND